MPSIPKVIAKKSAKKHVYENSKIGPALDDLGFVVSDYEQRSLVIFNSILVYNELYGNSTILRKFMVPSEKEIQYENNIIRNPWPKASWGTSLGRAAERIRYGKQFAHFHEALRQIGFSFENRKTAWGFENIYKGVSCFKKIYGHCEIKTHFIVPEDDRFPAHLYGMKLGSCVSEIRKHDEWKEYRKEWEELGINFSKRKTWKKNGYITLPPSPEIKSEESI